MKVLVDWMVVGKHDRLGLIRSAEKDRKVVAEVDSRRLFRCLGSARREMLAFDLYAERKQR